MNKVVNEIGYLIQLCFISLSIIAQYLGGENEIKNISMYLLCVLPNGTQKFQS